MGKLVRKEQCPQCGPEGDRAGDNLAVYEDDSTYCFACQYTSGNKSKEPSNLKKGTIVPIADRKITKETCEKYGVEILAFNGYMKKREYINERAVIFPIYKNGKVIDQKIRLMSDKQCQIWVNSTQTNTMFGQNAFQPSKNMSVVITEGEFDAMVVYQETGIPAISITKGAQSAAKQVAENMQWLGEWRDVILCFDNDEAGDKALQDCLPIFDYGLVRVCKLPEKDANDMLLQGKGDKLKKFMWDSQSIRPNTILEVADIRQQVLVKPTAGIKWPWAPMTETTFGFRTGEIYVLAAAEGVGKTEFIKELVFHMIDQSIPVGMFSLEQKPDDTIRRLIGGRVNKRLHIPTNDWWDEEVINKEIDYLQDKVFLYNTNTSDLSFDNVISNIKYLAKRHGVKFIIIDNLTALCSGAKVDGKTVRDSEYVGIVMNKFFSIIKELDITLFVVSHLATDKIGMKAYVSTSRKYGNDEQTTDEMDENLNKPGMHWESGRIPRLENIYGSGTVRKLADFILVLARNRVSEDYTEHRQLKVKFLKTRIDSSNEGRIFSLYYSYDTGRLEL
jgi:twinkle protein